MYDNNSFIDTFGGGRMFYGHFEKWVTAMAIHQLRGDRMKAGILKENGISKYYIEIIK